MLRWFCARKVGGQLLTVAETTADNQGRFRIEHLPADAAYVYLPGANRDGIHYPGPSVQLSGLSRRANVKLAVHDSVAFPNPLVVRRHDILLRPEQGALRVTESMRIDNPGSACYVGRAAGEDAQPVTLQLAIPSSFDRVTFESEQFGRRFSLIDGKLVTSIPWPPGQRDLTFSYLLPNAQRNYVWQRPLDLPSAAVRVSVCTNEPGHITCNLNHAQRQKNEGVVFEAGERTLPAGYLLRVELGHLHVSLMTYAPWLALALLAGLIIGTSVATIFRRTKHETSAMTTSAHSFASTRYRRLGSLARRRHG